MQVENQINQNREHHHKVIIDFTYLYHRNKVQAISKCPRSFHSKLSNFYKKLDKFLYSYLKL